MSLRIASWNIEGRFSDTGSKSRGTPANIIKAIKELDADVLVLPEAHSEHSLNDLKSCRQQLGQMGYHIYDVPYQDDMALRSDTGVSRLSLVLLSRLKIDKLQIIRLADVRNALVALAHKDGDNHQFRVIGLHLDDRSETTRLSQIADLSKIINQSELPTIVMGDFNAMHGKDLWPARFLRSKPIRFLSHIILPSVSMLAVEMARGETLHLLETDTKLSDADIRHQPTTTPKMRKLNWMPSIRLIQIDHIFISKNISLEKFQIASDGGADHRAIIATLSIK